MADTAAEPPKPGTVPDGDGDAKASARDQFASILRDAQELSAGALSEKSAARLEDFSKPPMRTAAELIAVVDSQNSQFENFRARRQKFFHVLDAAMRPIELVGDIVSGAASEVFPPGQHVYGAVMYLIQAARGVSDCFDAIIELLAQIQDFTTRLDLYLQPNLSVALRTKIVEILATVFEVLVLAAEAVRRGRLKAYWRNLFGSDTKVPDAMKKLARLTEAEERLAIAETHYTVKKSLSNQERLAEMMARVDINVQTLRAETREKAMYWNQDKLKEILRPSVFPEDAYLAFNKSRTEGTCDWILDDPSLQAWIAGEARYLWIAGSPGTGKSYVVSRLIDWGTSRLALLQGQPDTSFGYFFFRENTPETRSVLQALRDVAYQLAESDSVYAKQLSRQLNSSDDIKTIASAFRRLLVEPYEGYSRRRRIFVLLDGLDEAEQDEVTELLNLLDDFRERVDGLALVNFALIGRTHLSSQLSDALARDDGQLRTIHVTADRNGRDVLAFITEGVQRARILRGSSDDIKEAIITTMAHQVAGLFILAQFMLADLNRKRHPRRILESLKSYPKEIEGMLHQTLSGLSATLSEEEAEDLNEMLRWVTCAEEPLTLIQMEAILSLKFGDPPLLLEESLREPYSCFFVLDRDDGLTTSDLLDQYDSHRRPSTSASDQSRHRHGSVDARKETVFASNKSTTEIAFFHSCISSFFRDHESSRTRAEIGGPAIGFELAAARLSVAKTCLRIFTDPEFFTLREEGASLQKYAGWYWQEHLRQVDLASTPPDEKQQIGRYLHTILTDETVILTWTNVYDESLEIFTDANIDGFKMWFSDPDVLEGLNPEARSWAVSAASKSNGFVEPVGRVFAKAWVLDTFSTYMPTLFSFGVVQTVAYMEDGFKWSDAEVHWNDLPMEERVAKAEKWANIPTTAHSQRRIGSTFLSVHMYDEALAYYDRAILLDRDILDTVGRIGYCLTKKKEWQKALVRHLMCEDAEIRLFAEGKQRPISKWRLYKNQFQIAICYYQLGRIEDSLIYFRKAINAMYEPQTFEPELAYLEALTSQDRHDEVMQLLVELEMKVDPTEDNRLVSFLVDQAMGLAIMEWLPRSAIRMGMANYMIAQLEKALEAAERRKDAAQALVIQLGISKVYGLAGNLVTAIAIDETVCFVTSRPRGSVSFRYFSNFAFRHLAYLYHRKAMQAEPNSAEAEPWINNLERLAERQRIHQTTKMPIAMHGTDVIDASIFRGLYYRRQGKPDEAHRLFSIIIRESLNILDDEEPNNDVHAYRNILRVLLAWGDLSNARALGQSMRRPPTKRQRSPDFAESPVDARISLEPLLPEIQSMASTCEQCLKNISDSEDMNFCLYCLAPYCVSCLEGIIKVQGTAAQQPLASTDMTIVCRKDHEWLTIPPLDRDLGRGEILMDSGEVHSVYAWKASLRSQWIGEHQRA